MNIILPHGEIHVNTSSGTLSGWTWLFIGAVLSAVLGRRFLRSAWLGVIAFTVIVAAVAILFGW